jgi:hypothetical protein
MSFFAALPAIAEAIGGAAEAGGAVEGATASEGMSSGQMGRLGNMTQGMNDGKPEQQKTEPNDIMSDIGTEAHRYL